MPDTLCKTDNCSTPVDMGRLHMVAESDKEKIVLISLFFRQAEEVINAISQDLHNNEFLRCGRAAHKLKGSALDLGMNVLADHCLKLEKGSTLANEQRAVLLRDIKSELQRIKNFIRREYPSLSATES